MWHCLLFFHQRYTGTCLYFVFHLTLPRSIEDYFQEAGRDGRDGNPSSCILWFRFGDRNQLMNTMSAEKSEEEIEFLKNSINSVVMYCIVHSMQTGVNHGPLWRQIKRRL